MTFLSGLVILSIYFHRLWHNLRAWHCPCNGNSSSYRCSLTGKIPGVQRMSFAMVVVGSQEQSHSSIHHWVRTPQKAMHLNLRIWNHSFMRKSCMFPYVCVCKYMCPSNFFHSNFFCILQYFYFCVWIEFFIIEDIYI